MDKTTQDKIWSILSKEEREIERGGFRTPPQSEYSQGYDNARKSFFGHHNLTSDTEPEELLMVSRKRVQDFYASFQSGKVNTTSSIERLSLGARMAMLEELFTKDKCQPDTPNTPSSGELKSKNLVIEDTGFGGMNLTPPKVKLDVNLFRVGDKVRIKPNAEYFHQGYQNGYAWLPVRDKYVGKVYCVKEIWQNGDIILDIPELIMWSSIDLEPYHEEKNEESESEEIYNRYFPPKNDMEEKELNLCELLKGCEGMELYNTAYGKCTLNCFHLDNNNGKQPLISVKLADGTCRNFTADGKISYGVNKFAPISLFPYSLYEKYPLDATTAWKIWSEERKPKPTWWRAKEEEQYWSLNMALDATSHEESGDYYDRKSYKNGNYFRTLKEAQQAAEEVRKTLESFHNRKEGEK